MSICKVITARLGSPGWSWRVEYNTNQESVPTLFTGADREWLTTSAQKRPARLPRLMFLPLMRFGKVVSLCAPNLLKRGQTDFTVHSTWPKYQFYCSKPVDMTWLPTLDYWLSTQNIIWNIKEEKVHVAGFLTLSPSEHLLMLIAPPSLPPCLRQKSMFSWCYLEIRSSPAWYVEHAENLPQVHSSSFFLKLYCEYILCVYCLLIWKDDIRSKNFPSFTVGFYSELLWEVVIICKYGIGGHDLTLGSPWETLFTILHGRPLSLGCSSCFLRFDNIVQIFYHRIVSSENMQNRHQRQLCHSRPNTWLSPGIWLQCWCSPVTQMHQCDTPMHQCNALSISRRPVQ